MNTQILIPYSGITGNTLDSAQVKPFMRVNDNFTTINVEAQVEDKDSVFSLMQRDVSDPSEEQGKFWSVPRHHPSFPSS